MIPWVFDNTKVFARPSEEADREKYEVIRPRYSSDISGEEFALMSGLLPRRGGVDANPIDARKI